MKLPESSPSLILITPPDPSTNRFYIRNVGKRNVLSFELHCVLTQQCSSMQLCLLRSVTQMSIWCYIYITGVELIRAKSNQIGLGWLGGSKGKLHSQLDVGSTYVWGRFYVVIDWHAILTYVIIPTVICHSLIEFTDVRMSKATITNLMCRRFVTILEVFQTYSNWIHTNTYYQNQKSNQNQIYLSQ